MNLHHLSKRLKKNIRIIYTISDLFYFYHKILQAATTTTIILILIQRKKNKFNYSLTDQFLVQQATMSTHDETLFCPVCKKLWKYKTIRLLIFFTNSKYKIFRKQSSIGSCALCSSAEKNQETLKKISISVATLKNQ